MDLNDLRVPMLKAQLLARDRDARGTKNVLVGRLRDALQEEGVDVEHFVAGLLGAPSSDPLRVGVSSSNQPAASLGGSGARDLEAGGAERLEPGASRVSLDSLTRDTAAGPMLDGFDANPAGSVGISAVGPDAGVSHDVRDVRGTDGTAARDPGAAVSRNDRDALEMVAADRVEVHADDSASQINCGGSALSGHSSASARSLESLRIRESAKQAALRVRMKFLRDKQKLEVKEQELRMKREELKLREALEESEVREAALTPSRLNSVVSGVTTRKAGDVKSVQLPKKQLLIGQSEVQQVHRSLSSGLFSRTNPGGVTEGSTADLGKPMEPPKQQLITRQPEVQQTQQSSGSSGASRRSCRDVQGPDIRLSGGAAEVETSDLQVSVMKRLLTSSLLPKPDVPVFSGDVTRFHQFLRAFDSRVDAIVEDDESKAYYLEQFTSGIPRDIVRGCMYLPSGGYREARGLLQRRYGNPDRVADAFVDRVLDWPVLKAEDVAGLDRFALELRTCLNAVGGLLPENNELDHPKTMIRLLEKVPYSLQDRWRRRMDGLTEREGRRARFSDLVAFIEEESRIASDPTFGRQVFTRRAATPREQRSEKVKERSEKVKCYAASGDALTEKAPCLFCRGIHALDTCSEFAGSPLSARQNFVRRNDLCFSCLKPGHRSRWCKERLTCAVCEKGHPSVLHVYDQATAVGGEQRTASGEEPLLPSAVVNVVSAGRGGSAAPKMPIVPVKVRCRGGPVVETYAFLDSGSSSSFCSRDLAWKLDVTLTDKARLTISTMAKEPLNVLTSAIEGLTISDMDENHVIRLPAVFALDKIPAGREEVCLPEDLDDWPHLQDVIPGEIDADVGLLLGVNVPTALEPVDVMPSRDGGPFAVKTRLGWVVNGPVRHQRWVEMRSSANRIRVEQRAHQLDSENLASEELGWSVEDHRWLQRIEDGCKMVEGHFELPLPLKSEKPTLPDNRESVQRRLQGLRKKFEDNEFATKYRDFMNDMFRKGYAEKVPDKDLGRRDGRVNYIPHHGVLQKPGKLRVVFDCSSTYRGVSLNDSLLQGPDLTTPLVDVLIRFRQEQVAFIGDVESMFYQVRIPPNDRDLLRFLWWPSGDVNRPPEIFRMTVHPFGARSSPSCANYALRRTAQEFGHEFSESAARTVTDNFYVDDCLRSVDDVRQATSLIQELRDLCSRAGFRLTKFLSSHREVLQSVPRDERGKQIRDLDLDQDLPSEKALGVHWKVEPDAIGFATADVSRKPCTRRGMLAILGSVYDPLGMAAPLVLYGRLILQELTRRQYGWDDIAPEDLQVKWDEWVDDLPVLSKISLPRCLKPQDFGQVKRCEIHHFSDASSIGYGVVSYLRLVSRSGRVHCSFIFGKARVLPVKGMTIPRAELTAATLAARIDVVLRRALQLQIDESIFWTDSTTVIRYIRNEHTRFHTFVSNRLAVIRDASSPRQWRYVESNDNPGDSASRGQNAAVFVNSRRWFNGPDFLWRDRGDWPQAPAALDEDVTEADHEVRRAVMSTIVKEDRDPLLVLFSHYSGWYRLRRAVAWILRVKKALRDLVRNRTTSDRTPRRRLCDSRITVADLQEAEHAVLVCVQRQVFQSDVEALLASGSVKSTSCLARLDPFLAGDLIRVGGRVTNSSFSLDRKHPAILPKRHHVVDLIIQQAHEEVGHSGREHVLSQLRERYWIVSGNAAVRRVLGRCLSCRRRQGQFLGQKMADLPADRVMADEPPFSSTGIDFFGPFFVRRGRGQEKRYGVIFTCLASRAVHLEVAESLSTDSFLCALRRFIARRGQVKRIRSDHGANFVGANNELRAEVERLSELEPVVHQALLAKNIEWVFNTPGASHHGGIWERMIRSIRKVLDALMTQQVLSDEALRTLLCEVEAILNSRPLTYVSPDHRDPEPLSANHLLLLGGSVPAPIGVFRADDLYAKRRWRQVQYLADLFGQGGGKNTFLCCSVGKNGCILTNPWR